MSEELNMQTGQKELTGYASIDKPWTKFYPVNPDITVKGSLYDYLKDRNINNLYSRAITYFGKEYNFNEFFSLIDGLSSIYLQNGIMPGDKVIVLGLNTPEIIGSIYALNKIGAICCIESVLQLETSLAEMIKKYDTKYIVILDIIFDKYKNVLFQNSIRKIFLSRLSDSMPMPLKIVSCIKNKRMKNCSKIVPLWMKTKNASDEVYRWNAENTAALLSTSGSTGVPKRAELSNRAINSLACQTSYVDLDLKPGKSMLSPAPPFLAYGISLTIHMPLCNGMCVILLPNPDPNFVSKQFLKYKPNMFIGGRVFLDKIMKSDKDMSFVSAIEIGGEAVAVEYIDKVEQFLREHNSKGKVLTGYGMTELSGSSTTESRTVSRKGSVGIPNCGVNMKVVNTENEEELPYNKEGELCINSPCLMNSYFDNKDETNKVLFVDEQGCKWIKTGDLAKIDEDGFVYIVGRIKRIAVAVDSKTKTQIKIYLDYIETLINGISIVERSAVIAVDDEVRKSVPIAYVLLSVSQDNAEEWIKKELISKTETYNIPEKIIFVEEMPVLSNGKIDYKKLKEML